MVSKKKGTVMGRFLPIFFMSLFMFGTTAYAQAKDVRIGFVDMQKSIISTKEWKRESLNFQKDLEKEKRMMDLKEKKIKKLFDDLNKQEYVLSDELKKKKREEFREEKKDFERYVQDLNEKFSRQEKEVKNKIITKMLEVIEKLGKERKYNMIIEKTALFYSSEDNDLTAAAILMYDKTYK